MCMPVRALHGPAALVVLLGVLAGCASAGTRGPANAGAPDADAVEAGTTARDTEDDRSTVTADDIGTAPQVPLEQLLQGKVAGVWVTRASDGSIVVRIRGRSTIRGSSAPLYVVDGVAIQPGPGGALSGIQPTEIASIEVLKDAIATSMYGARGANGVIVVKLKRPDE